MLVNKEIEALILMPTEVSQMFILYYISNPFLLRLERFFVF